MLKNFYNKKFNFIAKNKFSAAVFSTFILKNYIKRSYLGLCKGNVYEAIKVDPKLKDLSGFENITDLKILINSPIKRKSDSTIERVVAIDGEPAMTKVFALKYFEKFNITLCKFVLLTGRTHQIRVHMKHIGYPIIGDFLYNPDYSLINRQALHSSELLLVHPINKRILRFDARIPSDMKLLIN